MSLTRRKMMYGLGGLAAMGRNLMAEQHHHHHASELDHHASELDHHAVQAFLDASGAADDKAPGVTGQGEFKFKVLYASDHLPPEAQKVLVKAHGGFAVDRRHGKEETYFALPGAGILQISGDLKTINLIDTPDEMRNTNLHDTNIWYDKDGTAFLVMPANSEGKIFTSTLDGKLVHKLDASTEATQFKDPKVHDYFVAKNNFAPTAVEHMDGMYYVTTGYCKLDYVLTARVTPHQTFEAVWNDFAFAGRGDAPNQLHTGHGITKPPGKNRLDVADRPRSRFARFTPEGEYLSELPMPSGSLPCDINYLDQKYSVVPALDGPDKTKGAPIYFMEHEKLVSTIMIKEDLGLPNFKHIHNAALRKIGKKYYILALAWNPGDFAILEQV